MSIFDRKVRMNCEIYSTTGEHNNAHQDVTKRCLPCQGVRFRVFGKTSLTGKVIRVEIAARKGSRGLCSICDCESPGYDHTNERRFRFIPLWRYDVEFAYRLRRVKCPKHGVIVERLPWADSRSPICEPFNLTSSMEK